VYESEDINPNLTSPGAAIALALMYLKYVNRICFKNKPMRYAPTPLHAETLAIHERNYGCREMGI